MKKLYVFIILMLACVCFSATAQQDSSATYVSDIGRPATVQISAVYQGKNYYSNGTGVVVSPDGYIITNAHVVKDEKGKSADGIVVSIPVGEGTYKQYLARIVKVGDEATSSPTAIDLAVLQIDVQNLYYVTLGDDDLVTGENLYCMGYPGITGEFTNGNYKNASLTSGVMSAKEKIAGYGTEYIESELPVDHGNSGGPIFDKNAQVVAIASIGLGGASTVVDGNNVFTIDSTRYSYSLPAKYVKQFLNECNIKVPDIVNAELTKEYVKGVKALNEEKGKNAVAAFKNVRDIDANFLEINKMIDRAKNIGGGSDITITPTAITILVVILVVIIFIVGFSAIIRKKPKSKIKPGPAPWDDSSNDW